MLCYLVFALSRIFSYMPTIITRKIPVITIGVGVGRKVLMSSMGPLCHTAVATAIAALVVNAVFARN